MFLIKLLPLLNSSSTPESLGLKHLAVRPKKQQLIEDQRQKVAKENAKLMSGMTKVFIIYIIQLFISHIDVFNHINEFKSLDYE